MFLLLITIINWCNPDFPTTQTVIGLDYQQCREMAKEYKDYMTEYNIQIITSCLKTH